MRYWLGIVLLTLLAVVLSLLHALPALVIPIILAVSFGWYGLCIRLGWTS